MSALKYLVGKVPQLPVQLLVVNVPDDSMLFPDGHTACTLNVYPVPQVNADTFMN